LQKNTIEPRTVSKGKMLYLYTESLCINLNINIFMNEKIGVKKHNREIKRTTHRNKQTNTNTHKLMVL